MRTKKQPHPNENWCVGCDPTNCCGCRGNKVYDYHSKNMAISLQVGTIKSKKFGRMWPDGFHLWLFSRLGIHAWWKKSQYMKRRVCFDWVSKQQQADLERMIKDLL